MTEEIRTIARAAAKEAVAEHYQLLGYDIADPEERRALQADFAHMRRAREGAEEVARIVRRSALMVAIGGLLWVIWEGLRLALRVETGG